MYIMQELDIIVVVFTYRSVYGKEEEKKLFCLHLVKYAFSFLPGLNCNMIYREKSCGDFEISGAVSERRNSISDYR